MRRNDREVTDFDEIVKIIDECEVLRLGLADGDYPYIVPMNFAYRVTDGRIDESDGGVHEAGPVVVLEMRDRAAPIRAPSQL